MRVQLGDPTSRHPRRDVGLNTCVVVTIRCPWWWWVLSCLGLPVYRWTVVSRFPRCCSRAVFQLLVTFLVACQFGS